MDEETKKLIVQKAAKALTAEFSKKLKVLEDENDNLRGQIRAVRSALEEFTKPAITR